MAAPTVETDAEPIALDDVQGLVATGYKQLAHAAAILVRLGEPAAARRWLAATIERVPTAAAARGVSRAIHVALSPAGMTALGAPATALDGLADEAKQGMARRARLLGDVDGGAPSTWDYGGTAGDLHAVVIAYADSPAARDALADEEARRIADTGGVVVAIESTAPLGPKEPFGFADGASQPLVRGLPGPAPRPGQDTIPTGEILLGYVNGYGHRPRGPVWGDVDLGRNGTYLVFRKLEQDVIGFWTYFARKAQELFGADTPEAIDRYADWLAAKTVGRWRSGAPLVVAPDADDAAATTPDRINDFGFLDDDAHGLRCPVGAHIRRANPRDARGGTAESSRMVSNRHRLLRRSRVFGPAIERNDILARRPLSRAPRGLIFMSLQASIARGFEFVQQTWLSNPGFGGVHREVDPLVGGGPGDGTFTIPASPVALRLHNIPRFVTMRGGDYFFLPSLTALRRLAADGPASRG
jgi:Dyp-type peroxidase family